MLYKDFRPWEKPSQHTWKNLYFFTCWYSQSAADTPLAFGATRSGWWMKGKALTILNTSCLSEFHQIMTAKTFKNPYRWQTERFKLSYKAKKTNKLKEKPKVTHSVALVLAFLSAENENRQLEDLPLANFGRLPKLASGKSSSCRFSFSAERNANTKATECVIYLKDFLCR